ncbi:MAG: hypothetical protein NZL90_04770 [Aquificaceae bacterium]|nr:hypothetical protein [Aquificaceae bacterium]MDW8237726.1 hypothetical protein [Aquificaceae bacterium]
MFSFQLPSTIGGCLQTGMLGYGFGALMGFVLISKLIKDSRPVWVASAKEIISFQQWLNANLEEGKEFWEDVVSEAKNLYKMEIERKLEILQKQQEILERLKSSVGG